MKFIEPENSFPISSPNMIAIYEEIADYAYHDQPCVFFGPTGVGKEYAARYYYQIWRAHKNGSGLFQSLNCSLLSETLAHSELFGHVKGAFTGATYTKPGFFETAKHGILFLDEIADLPLTVQPMLLRAIDPEKGTAIRLGDLKHYPTTNVRVLTATDQPVQRIRPSLLERLGMRITIPALAERQLDRDQAVRYFIFRALCKRKDIDQLRQTLFRTEKHQATATEWMKDRSITELVEKMAEDLIPLAAMRIWPGNFRSLRVAIDTAIMRTPRYARPDRFCADAIKYFSQHAPTYSESVASGRRLSLSPSTAPKVSKETALYSQIARALQSASEEEIQQWISWLHHNADRTFTIAELKGNIENLQTRALQYRIQSLTNAGLLERNSGRPIRYRRTQETETTMPVSKKNYQELFPLPEDHAGNGLEEKLQALEDILHNARHLFLGGGSEKPASSLMLKLGHKLSGVRTVYYYRMEKEGLVRWFDLWATWFIEQGRLQDKVYRHCKERGLTQAALLLAGYAESLFIQDTQPLFLLDQVHRIRRQEERTALETVLICWPGLQFLLHGNKLHAGPEVEKNIVEVSYANLAVKRKDS